MNNAFPYLSDKDLKTLIAALRTRHLVSPFRAIQVSHVLPTPLSDTISEALGALGEQGFTSQQITTVLELIASDRSSGRVAEVPIDLVTSGGAYCYNRRYSEPGAGSGTPKWEMSGIRDDGICALQSAQDIGSDVNHDLYFVISNETSMIWRLPIQYEHGPNN